MTNVLAKRFDEYFHHPDERYDVLRPGDRAIACRNVRIALHHLNVEVFRPDNSLQYDEGLHRAVTSFQVRCNHPICDGVVGPGTRERLVIELLRQFPLTFFERHVTRPEHRERPSVFISYAWSDSENVDKLDQWLRDRGVRVVRDREFFVAGMTLQENIARALAMTDKILVVLSADARDRDWPHFERSIAEQVESQLGTRVLVYLRLDNPPLSAHDSTRLAIVAEGRTLKEIGEQVLHAVAGIGRAQPTYQYKEDEPL